MSLELRYPAAVPCAFRSAPSHNCAPHLIVSHAQESSIAMLRFLFIRRPAALTDTRAPGLLHDEDRVEQTVV